MSKNRLGHTACHRGKKVLVTLRNGERFVDRFMDRTGSKVVVLQGRGRIPMHRIASVSIYREQFHG